MIASLASPIEGSTAGRFVSTGPAAGGAVSCADAGSVSYLLPSGLVSVPEGVACDCDGSPAGLAVALDRAPPSASFAPPTESMKSENALFSRSPGLCSAWIGFGGSALAACMVLMYVSGTPVAARVRRPLLSYSG